jgi:hypothetical protein
MYDALTDFRNSLRRVNEITVEIDAQAPQALADHRVAERLETLRCALVVILTGYLESFLRDTAQSFITNVNSRGIPYSTLPEKLRLTNLEEGGRALMHRVREERGGRTSWITASSADIASRLGSINSPTSCDLVWEGFAQTRANPNFNVIKDFLSNLAVSDPANSLAAATGISHQLINTTLESLLTMRNESAHSGQPSIVPTPSTLRDFCDFLDKLGSGLVQILSQQLRQSGYAPHRIRL